MAAKPYVLREGVLPCAVENKLFDAFGLASEDPRFVAGFTGADLLSIPQLGSGGLAIVETWLAQYGLRLAGPPAKEAVATYYKERWRRYDQRKGAKLCVQSS